VIDAPVLTLRSPDPSDFMVTIQPLQEFTQRLRLLDRMLTVLMAIHNGARTLPTVLEAYCRPTIGPSGSNYAMGSEYEFNVRLLKAGFTAWHCRPRGG
jgi:hypothetical protein